ncbi:hypothetical protein [Nocardioides sp.]|uniref:hypothetical protein n=1 Tax=Nocardioides sp. TaxID=35761 RepID=UPI00260B4D00|nr:hypothetical protein [Nocardioides sp.]
MELTSQAEGIRPAALTSYRRAVADGGALDPATPGEVVQELRRLGLIEETPAGPRVCAPGARLHQLAGAYQAEAASIEQIAADLTREWTRHHEAGVSDLFTGEVVGRRWAELVAEARHDVRGTSIRPSVPAPPLSAVPTQDDALDRGVEIRALYDAAVLDDARGLEIVRAGVRQGEQARIVPDLACRFLVIDSATLLLIPPYDVFESRQGLLSRHPGLVESFARIFDQMWITAVPVPSTGETDGVTDDESRRLLTLLALGLSDAAVARELGISVRTLSRRITALQQRTGCSSRFQLGFQASTLLEVSGG